MTPYIRVDYTTEETILRGTEVILELWNGTPNTKVHWVSQTEDIDWTTSTTDGSGYTLAFYKVDKPEGTYKIYAWDEVAGVATNVVTIKVTELTPTGSIYCTSTPSEAAIYLSLANTGKVTPATLTGLAPSTYFVEYKKTGYNTCSGAIGVRAGQTTNAPCTLTPTSSTETHLVCQSNICKRVSSPGTDECTPEGSSCGTPPTSATHALQFSLSPLSWADNIGLSNYLPSITTAFAEAITLYGWIGWTVVETRIEGNNLVIYLRETATAGHMSTLAWPTVAAISAAAVFIIGIALRFGYLIIAYKLIELATGIVKVEQTKSESEQLRIKTITDLCNEGKLTPEQCNELLEKSKPGTGLCGLLGLDDQVCTDLKYIGIGIGALIVGYTIYKILPKNK